MIAPEIGLVDAGFYRSTCSVAWRVLPYIIQIPGIDPKWLAKEVLKRMDDKLDLDEALSENAESIVAMNGMKDANAAAGMQQGVQGSMNAPQQGSPAGGSTARRRGP